MHENYVNGPWPGFNVLHIIKKLNRKGSERYPFYLEELPALVRHVFEESHCQGSNHQQGPLEKTYLFQEENRLKDLSLCPTPSSA